MPLTNPPLPTPGASGNVLTSNGTIWTSAAPAAGSTTPPPAGTGKVLTYASNGDTNGVCYWIGTNYGVQAWENPHTAGRITCAMSTSESGTVSNVVDRINNNNYTQPLPNSWRSIDLGIKNTLVLNHYVLQKWSGLNRAIRNWKLQGSNNVLSNSVADLNNATWIDLDIRVNDLTMADNSYSYGNYSVTGSESIYGYRWFRLLQTGLNANNDNYLMVTEFEFYGTLKTTT